MDREQLIQKYLHDTLTTDEHKLFLDAIESNPSYKQQVEIEATYYAKRNRELKAELKEGAQAPTISTNTKNKNTRTLKALLIAALFIIPLIYFFTNKESREETKEQFAINSIEDVFPASSILMGESKKTKDNWSTAMSHYRKNEFTQAAQLITTITDKTEEQELYLSLCHLYNAQYDKALQGLTKVKKQNRDFTDVANWHIALIHEELGQLDLAKKYWEEIVATKSWNYKSAQARLKNQ